MVVVVVVADDVVKITTQTVKLGTKLKFLHNAHVVEGFVAWADYSKIKHVL